MSLNRRFATVSADSGIYSNTGTTANTFTVDSDSVTGQIVIDVTLGAADKALTLTNTALTDDRTATFQDASGTVAYLSDVLAAASTVSNTFTIDSDSELGKIILDVTTGAADKSLTITNTALTDDRTATFQDGDGTVCYTDGTPGATFTVDNDSTTGKITVSAASGAADKALTVTNTALTDDRTATFPDATGTVAYTSQVKQVAVLTAAQGTVTALATTGVDLADGNDTTYYGTFVAPYDLTLVKMHDYLTEAYVKESVDAKIEVYDDADTPTLLFGRTLTAEGEEAKNFTSTDPETGAASVTAGTRIDLKITATDSSSGTGHAVVMIEYILAA